MWVKELENVTVWPKQKNQRDPKGAPNLLYTVPSDVLSNLKNKLLGIVKVCDRCVTTEQF